MARFYVVHSVFLLPTVTAASGRNEAGAAAHAALMKKHPTMEHDDPWMTHVPAGKTGDVIWHFNRAGDVDFACLVKDHFELGTAGRIRVLAARR